MLLGTFPDTVTPDIDFTDEAIVQWHSSCKNAFVGAGNLQIITNKFWCEYLCGPYVLCLDAVLFIILVSWVIDAYNLKSWLFDKALSC